MPARRTELQVAIFNAALTQREIAQELGITESYLSRIVSGKRAVGDAMRERITAAIERLCEVEHRERVA